MLLKRQDHTEITIIKLIGEINRTDATELRRALEKLLEEKRFFVVLDMEETSFIGSHSIMILLRMNREFLASGGGIKLLKPRHVVKRFLSIGRVLELFDCYDVRIDALRSFHTSMNMKTHHPDPSSILREAGRQQRSVLLRLIEILQRKGVFEIESFYQEMNRSTQLVFTLFRDELDNSLPERNKSDQNSL